MWANKGIPMRKPKPKLKKKNKKKHNPPMNPKTVPRVDTGPLTVDLWMCPVLFKS